MPKKDEAVTTAEDSIGLFELFPEPRYVDPGRFLILG